MTNTIQNPSSYDTADSPSVGSPDDEQLATWCRALGHPHRVHILRLLLAAPTCSAGEIADQLPVAPSTVSQHLTQLRAAGLIGGAVHGPRRSYSVSPSAVATLKALIAGL